MSVRKKKPKDQGNGALHDATHGQFGEEPRPEPLPDDNESNKINDNRRVEDRRKVARRKSRTI